MTFKFVMRKIRNIGSNLIKDPGSSTSNSSSSLSPFEIVTVSVPSVSPHSDI